LSRLSFRSGDLETDVKVFTAICGVAPEWTNGSDGDKKTARFRVHHTDLELIEIDPNMALDESPPRPGFNYLELSCSCISTTIDALDKAGIPVAKQNTYFAAPSSKTNNVQVQFQKPDFQERFLENEHVHIDHVAIAVTDLISSNKCWGMVTDNQPTPIERHPLGNFEAARLLLGNQMIELVGSLPNVESAVSDRLTKTGEGVITVAIVANDLVKTARQLKEVGARLIEQGPHLMVHPKDSCGVLIQLTPRLNH
jgi:hypothetical protein